MRWMLLFLFYSQGKCGSEKFHGFQSRATNMWPNWNSKAVGCSARTAVALMALVPCPLYWIHVLFSWTFLIHLPPPPLVFFLTATPVVHTIVLSLLCLLSTGSLASSLIPPFSPSLTLTFADYSVCVKLCVTCFAYVILLIPCRSPHLSRKETSGQNSSKFVGWGMQFR